MKKKVESSSKKEGSDEEEFEEEGEYEEDDPEDDEDLYEDETEDDWFEDEDEMEEEEEEDELDEEDEEEPGDRDDEEEGFTGNILLKDKGRNLLTIGIAGMIIISIIGVSIIVSLQEIETPPEEEDEIKDPYDGIGSDVPSPNTLDARISEVMPSSEWFEIYIADAAFGTTGGWTFTTFDEELIPLPEVLGLDGFDHILVHTGNGTNDLDGSDGQASIFLNLGYEVLNDDGDELSLFDEEERIIDFVGWGEGNNDTPRQGWTVPKYADAPAKGFSISLQGDDLGSGSYWTEGPPSKLDYPLISVDPGEEYNGTIQVQNGRREPAGTGPIGEMEMKLVIKARRGVPAGHGVNRKDLEDVLEYVVHTYKLLRKMGFNVPMTTGTDSNGKPFLRLIVTKNGTFEGFANGSSGLIHVDIGSSKAASKQAVEHEMFHAFQFKARADGSYRFNSDRYTAFDEGMAEFFGRYSTMTNYDLTWEQMERELHNSSSMNIMNLSSNLDKNVFGDWPGEDLEDHYGMSFLFMKFLMDRFGLDILKKYHDSVRNVIGPNGTGKDEGDVLGPEAVEKATGQKFEDLLQQFMLWRVAGLFPQYKNITNWPGYDVANKHTFNGTSVEDVEDIEDYGTLVNEYIMNGSEGVLTVKPDQDVKIGISVILVKDDGTKEYLSKKIGPGGAGSIYIPPGYKKAVVLKTSLKETELGGRFRIKLQAGPVVTPMGPPNHDHIMWDPPSGILEWETSHPLENMSYRVQLDNTSTFSHPWHDIEVVGGEISEPIPRELANGTWWWRVAWEQYGEMGPWTDPWNFTIWRDFQRPDIMWDPEPVRYENISGSWHLISPDARVRIGPYQVPREVSTGPGSAQIRLSGPGGSILLEEPIDDWIDIGGRMDEGYDTLEWRVNFPPFDAPWFRDDILWDPAPPELEPFPVQLPRRQVENRTQQIAVNDTYRVESFFDVFIGINYPGEEPVPYTHSPMFNRTEGDLAVFDLYLNFGELDEGSYVFTLIARDHYGRGSKPLDMIFDVDRTGPDITIETLPSKMPTIYGKTFTVNVWSDDPSAAHVLVELSDSHGSVRMIEMVPQTPPTVHVRAWVGQVDIAALGISDGTLNITATVIDDMGNERSEYLLVGIDTTSPDIQIAAPGAGELLERGALYNFRVDTGESQLTIIEVRIVIRNGASGSEEANATVIWSSGSVWEGGIIVPETLPPGENRVEAYATDWAGNIGGSWTYILIMDP